MKNFRTLVVCTSFFTLLFHGHSADSSAAEYPTQAIKVVVGGPAGGSTDVIARRISESLSQRIGQRVLVENRPGASGAIAARFVAAAKPDGHTVLFCNSGTHGGNPVLMRDAGYDAVLDFVPVVRVATVPFILVVNLQLSANTVGDLVATAKSKPGKLRMGFASIGSFNHIVGELFQLQTGTDFLGVPYKGLNEVITDVAGGHIDAGFPTPGESLSMITAGRLKALMVTSTRRLPLLPAVPSAVEVGLRDSVLLGWGGLCAPAGTPTSVVKVLNEHTLAAVLAQPMRADLERIGYELGENSPDQFGQFIRAEIQRIANLVKQRGVRVEQ